MKVKNVMDVSVMLAAGNQVQQERRRKMLLKQLSSLKFLLRQGLAVRGHIECEAICYSCSSCDLKMTKNYRPG